MARTSKGAHLAAVMVRWASEATRIAEKTVGPLLDVYIRLWLAGIFWASGMVKLQSWTIALYLSAHEYPVSWLDPVTAAWLGETVEIVCPPLLVLGLATRFAALPMLILSLVIQFSYQALDQHLFWAILFGWFVVKGAGPISLDALIGRGIAATALPLAATITRIFEALSRWGDLAIKLLLRCWIAALFFRSGVMKISNFDMTQMLFHARSAQGLLPPELAARSTILFELACLIFLVLGAGTRITAILLIGLIAVVDPTFQHQIDLAYYLMVLGLIALYGPGALSLDSLVLSTLLRRFPELESIRTVSYEGTPRVVIVGGGFGGVAAAKALRNTSCRVTLIDQRNYYLFQPLLYQVATAGLSPADIAGPIRGLFRDQANVRVLLGGVTDVDLGAREVIIGDARVPYDFLVIAAGARHSYFGHDEWAPFAPGLKQIEDATNIRSRLLFAFEQAENAELSGGAARPADLRDRRRRSNRRRAGRSHRRARPPWAFARFPRDRSVDGAGDPDAIRASDSADISGGLVSAGDGGLDGPRRRGADGQCRRTDRRRRRCRLRPLRGGAQCVLGRGRDGLSCRTMVAGRS